MINNIIVELGVTLSAYQNFHSKVPAKIFTMPDVNLALSVSEGEINDMIGIDQCFWAVGNK